MAENPAFHDSWESFVAGVTRFERGAASTDLGVQAASDALQLRLVLERPDYEVALQLFRRLASPDYGDNARQIVILAYAPGAAEQIRLDLSRGIATQFAPLTIEQRYELVTYAFTFLHSVDPNLRTQSGPPPTDEIEVSRPLLRAARRMFDTLGELDDAELRNVSLTHVSATIPSSQITRLTPEQMFRELEAYRNFHNSAPAHATEHARVGSNIKARELDIDRLQKTKFYEDLTERQRKSKISRHRTQIKKLKKRLSRLAEGSRVDQLQTDLANAIKNRDTAKSEAIRKKLGQINEDLGIPGRKYGFGEQTFAVVQVEMPNDKPVLFFSRNTTKGHAEQNALPAIKQFLAREVGLPQDIWRDAQSIPQGWLSKATDEQRARVAKTRIDLMPDQLVCNGNCRPDLRDFSKQTGISEIYAHYIVQDGGNDVPTGKMSVKDLGNAEKAIRSRMKQLDLRQPKGVLMGLSSGATDLQSKNTFVITEAPAAQKDFQINIRDANLDELQPPGPPTRLERSGRGFSGSVSEADVDSGNVLFKSQFRNRLKSIARTIGKLGKRALQTLSALAPFLQIMEMLDAVGESKASKYRKQVELARKQLLEVVIDARHQDVEYAELTSSLFSLSLEMLASEINAPAGYSDAIDTLFDIEGELNDQLSTYSDKLDIARQSLKEVKQTQKFVTEALDNPWARGLMGIASEGFANLTSTITFARDLPALIASLERYVLLIEELIRLTALNQATIQTWQASLLDDPSLAVEIPNSLLEPIAPDKMLGI